MFIRVNAFPLGGYALTMAVLRSAQQYQNVRFPFFCIIQTASLAVSQSFSLSVSESFLMPWCALLKINNYAPQAEEEVVAETATAAPCCGL